MVWGRQLSVESCNHEARVLAVLAGTQLWFGLQCGHPRRHQPLVMGIELLQLCSTSAKPRSASRDERFLVFCFYDQTHSIDLHNNAFQFAGLALASSDSILAEGAIVLSVTPSGGTLLAKYGSRRCYTSRISKLVPSWIRHCCCNP